MNEGVRILVERMKTNPEEFFEGAMSKWAYPIGLANGAKWLTEEERKVLDDAADNVQRERFTAEVLKALTMSDEERAERAKTDAWRLGNGRQMVGSGLTNAALTVTTASPFGAVPVKAEGQKVAY